MAEINRLVTLIVYLKDHQGVRVDEIARGLSTTPDEVERLLDRLLLCGVPPYYPNDYIEVYKEGDRVEIRLAEQFRRPIRFTLQEVAALRLALAEAAGDANEATGGAIDGLRERLPALSPGARAAQAEGTSADGVVAIAGPRSRVKDCARTLDQASKDRAVVRIRHYSTTRAALTEREIEPWALMQHGSFLYCGAFDRRRNQPVTFRVDRMRDIEPTGETFDAPPAAEIDALMSRPLRPRSKRGRGARKFTIRLSAAAAHRAKESWDKKAFCDRGDGTVDFTAPLADASFPCAFALPFGDDAELVDPPEVRTAMRDRIESAIAALADA